MKYQKLLRWWIIISILVIIIGLAFAFPAQADGRHLVNLPIVLIGIASISIGSPIIAIMMLVAFIRQAKAYNKYLEDNNIDERAEEEAFKAYINNTRHNQEATAFRALSLWLRANKNAPKPQGIRPWVNLVLLIIFGLCALTFMPLLCAGQMVAGLALFATAFAMIFLLLIIALVHKKIAANPKNIDYNVPSQPATVKSCSISSESSVGSGAHYHLQTNRILSTTYLICLDVGGEEKQAYSKTYYNKGETVRVHQNRKLKNMVIIEEEKPLN